MEQSWGLDSRPLTYNEERIMGKLQDLQSNCPSGIWLCESGCTSLNFSLLTYNKG